MAKRSKKRKNKILKKKKIKNKNIKQRASEKNHVKLEKI